MVLEVVPALKGRPWVDGNQEKSEAGAQIAGGFSLALVAATGDIEWVSEGYKLQHHLSGNPCSKCKANSREEEYPWTDPKMSATWRTTLRTSSE